MCDFYEHFKRKEKCSIKNADTLIKCIDYCLVRNHYKLTTSEKKFLVKTIEKSNPAEFLNAATESNSITERFITVLEFLNYNKFSRSVEHQLIVNDLRNGRFRTSDKILKRAGENFELDTIIDVLKQHPALFITKIDWCLDCGILPEDLIDLGKSIEDRLSIREIIMTLTYLNTDLLFQKTSSFILREILKHILAKKDLGIKNKTIRFSCGNYIAEACFPDKEYSKILSNIRYIRIAVRWRDSITNSIDLITTKEINSNISILGHGTKGDGICTSKDNCGIKCSEWIDLDLEKVKGQFSFSVHLYSGRNTFSKVHSCEFIVSALDSFHGNVTNVLSRFPIVNRAGFVDLGTLKIGDENVFSFRIKSSKYSIIKLLSPNSKFGYSCQDLIDDLAESQHLRVVEEGEDVTFMI